MNAKDALRLSVGSEKGNIANILNRVHESIQGRAERGYTTAEISSHLIGYADDIKVKALNALRAEEYTVIGTLTSTHITVGWANVR